MRIYIFTLFIFASSVSNGQIDSLKLYKSYKIYNNQVINRIDINGHKQGQWITFAKEIAENSKIEYGKYSDSSIYFVANYKNNKAYGYTRLYYPDGNVRTLSKYVNNKLDSIQTEFAIDGCVLVKRNFKSGIATDYWEWYDTCNCLARKELRNGNNVLKTLFYKECKLVKIVSEVGENSMHLEMSIVSKKPYIVDEGAFKDDSIYTGHRNYYDKNGSLIKSIQYKNGLELKNGEIPK